MGRNGELLKALGIPRLDNICDVGLPERDQSPQEQAIPHAEVRPRSLSRQCTTASGSKNQSPKARYLYGDFRDVLTLDTTSTTRRIRPHAAVGTRLVCSSDGLAMLELGDVQQPQ